MKKTVNKTIVILLIIIGMSILNIMPCKSVLQAASTGTTTINLTTDSSNQKENKILKINISLTNFKNVDLSTPIAMSATLKYDTNIFQNPTITGKNGYSAAMNNNKMVIDSNSAKEGDIIAEISLGIKQSITSDTKTDISLTNVEIANDDTLDMKLDEIKTTVTVLKNTTSSSNNNNDDNKKTNETPANNTTANDKTSNNTISNTTNTNNKTNENENNTKNDDILVVNNVINNTNTSTTTKANTTANEKEEKVSKIEPVKDTTTSKKAIPQTGQTPIIIVAIVALIIIGVTTFIRYKKFYD